MNNPWWALTCPAVSSSRPRICLTGCSRLYVYIWAPTSDGAPFSDHAATFGLGSRPGCGARLEPSSWSEWVRMVMSELSHLTLSSPGEGPLFQLASHGVTLGQPGGRSSAERDSPGSRVWDSGSIHPWLPWPRSPPPRLPGHHAICLSKWEIHQRVQPEHWTDAEVVPGPMLARGTTTGQAGQAWG